MARDIQHIVASYDVHDPKRLTKVAKIMKDYGERVLKSVFECEITDERFERLKASVEDVIDHMEDSVRYYLLCDKCVKGVKVSGRGRRFKKDEPFVIT